MAPITAQTEAKPAAADSAAAKKLAQEKQKAKLHQACQMFEAMFLNLLWKEMRRTVDKTGLMHGGYAEDMFTNMMDEAVSQASAGGESMGIASMLERQLSQTAAARPSGRLGQKTTPQGEGGQALGYFKRPLKPLSSKETNQTLAGSYDQTNAAWQALPGKDQRKETPLSKWY